MRYSRSVVLAALGTLLLVGCARKPKPAAPTPEPVQEATAPPTTGDDADARAREAAARAAAERARAVLEARVYFGYDRSDLSPEARAVLDAKLPVLRQSTSVTLVIAGHADERGSEEYNLALGMRRADAVKQYLVGYGVEAGRLNAVSKGEDEPLDPGHDEAAWAQNRRAEFRARGDVVAAQ